MKRREAFKILAAMAAFGPDVLDAVQAAEPVLDPLDLMREAVPIPGCVPSFIDDQGYIRIWAGPAYADRETAPFRIDPSIGAVVNEEVRKRFQLVNS